MAEEKRKKKRKKRAVILLAGIAAACGIYGVGRMQASADTDSKTVAVSVSEGEEIVYGQLTAVRGNEITYVTAEETGSTAGSQGGEEIRQADNGDGEGRPDRSEQGAGRSEADSPREAESGRGFSSGMQLPGVQEASGSRTFTYDNKIFKLTQEESTELIPVGTSVTTKLGTVTTFSRLTAGDNVAIVRNRTTGEITAVYIIG